MEDNKENTKENELNLNTDWENVINLIKKNLFFEDYKQYSLYKKEKGYLIEKTDDSSNYFFLFHEKKKKKKLM